MEYDVASAIGATVREVRLHEIEGKPAQAVVASRDYATDIADLWDAVTNIERIPRWFTPVSGELRLGGRYQIEGNASGTVTDCDPPNTFSITWEFAGQVSWVVVKLTRLDPDTTQLRLEHSALIDPEWEARYGPGAGGVGWDMSLLGLGEHIRSRAALPPEASTEWLGTENYKEFVRASSQAWRLADIASGKPADAATQAAANTVDFYTGEQTVEGQ